MDELARQLLDSDRRALARAISLVEGRRPEGRAVLAQVFPRTGRAAALAVTGAPGAGKSTLIAALVAARRAASRRVAVLSIDPSSSLTRGVLLGDRIRMHEHFLDPGVFIRSMSSGGWSGGLARRPSRRCCSWTPGAPMR
jgi:LAO/AO transport system kinase